MVMRLGVTADGYLFDTYKWIFGGRSSNMEQCKMDSKIWIVPAAPSKGKHTRARTTITRMQNLRFQRRCTKLQLCTCTCITNNSNNTTRVLAKMCKSVCGQITHKHANPLICQASYTNPVPVFKGTSQDEEGGRGGGHWGIGGGKDREREREREEGEGGRGCDRPLESQPLSPGARTNQPL